MGDDRVETCSDDIPDVLRTLAGVLPQFTGADLESQLQTYDTFLGLLSPAARPKVAALLQEAATHAPSGEVRARIEAAARSITQGGCAAEPYDHHAAMAAYQQFFRQQFPQAPMASQAPQAAVDPAAILAQLDKIEAEMKRINYWSENPPDLLAAAERGEIRSYLDAPTFELWLQGIFLPRARHAAKTNQLPSSSSVGEMARRQYDFMSIDENAADLLALLQEFDRMIEQRH
jgi:uncharacterized protein YqcC (DUF446 family)